MDVSSALAQLGLTKQEATIYVLLASEGELTGYEVAKRSGISRSNSYTALASLVYKGAAYVIEESATKYISVPISEFCASVIRQQQVAKVFLEKNMPTKKEEVEAYITIRGAKHILNKVKSMIDQAKHRIYISVAGSNLEEIIGDLEKATKRGLKVVLLTDPPFSNQEFIIYPLVKEERHLRLIVDSNSVLTGELTDSPDCTCLFSQKPNLVDLVKEAMKNEIKLIELTEKDSGGEKADVYQ